VTPALRAAAHAVCSDPQKLLMRCAHAAEVHPRRSATIIVFGGFSRNTDPEVKEDNNMTDELLLLHTDRWAHLEL
jgi:serine/threonine protein phosphatase PrpC